MNKTTTTTARAAAFAAAVDFLGEAVENAPAASARAGYPVMMNADGTAWVSDLGTRFEANRADGVTRNFWVEAEGEAENSAAEAARLAGEARRAALLAEIEEQAAAADAAAHTGRPEDVAEARREARRTRETVRLIGEAIAEAAAEGDDERAEALAARLARAEDIAAEAGAALLAIDPRARMTAPDFLTLDPAEAEKAIAAAVYGAARLLARKSADTAAELVDRYGEDARQGAFLRAWERAADPARAAVPLALFLAREAGNALARERYGATRAAQIVPAADVIRDKYHGERPAGAVDTDYHAAGKVESPEAAVIRAEVLPRALAAVREEYRETAATVAAALAAGYTLAEAAEALAVNYRMAARALEALRAAAEVIRAEDGETARLEAVIEADRHARAMLEDDARAAAVAAFRHEPMPDALPRAVTWTAPRPDVARRLAAMTYTERVIYAAANQAALRELFARA